MVPGLLIIPVIAVADVVIDLKGGKQVIIPVDKADVEQIRFTEAMSQGTQNGSPSLPPRPTSSTSKESATTSKYSNAITWQIGSERKYKLPSEVVKHAKDGDIIEIDAGTYRNDYATWFQNDLTIRGIDGSAHLESKGLIPNNKAIWITRGDNIVIENIEFSGATVKDTNGAGIRHEGGDLTVRTTFFLHNEN